MRKIVVGAVLVAALVTGSLFAARNFWPGAEPTPCAAARAGDALLDDYCTRCNRPLAIWTALDAQAPRKLRVSKKAHNRSSEQLKHQLDR